MRTREQAAAYSASVRMFAEQERTDGELLRCFLVRRDDAAFTELIARHARKVLAVCLYVTGHRQDAEDACQATLLKLMRKVDSLLEEENLDSWLKGVAFGIALNARRSKKRRQNHEGRCEKRSPAQPEPEAEFHELQTLLDAAVQHLPEGMRVVFVSCCLEGASERSVACKLGLTKETVVRRVKKARRFVRRELRCKGVIP